MPLARVLVPEIGSDRARGALVGIRAGGPFTPGTPEEVAIIKKVRHAGTRRGVNLQAMIVRVLSVN